MDPLRPSVFPAAKWRPSGKFRSSAVFPAAKWRPSGKFRSSGRVLYVFRIKLAPSAPVASKTRPDGPETTGDWAEFYALAFPGPFARISP